MVGFVFKLGKNKIEKPNEVFPLWRGIKGEDNLSLRQLAEEGLRERNTQFRKNDNHFEKIKKNPPPCPPPKGEEFVGGISVYGLD